LILRAAVRLQRLDFLTFFVGGLDFMRASSTLQNSNVFSGAMVTESEAGARVTANEFRDVVSSLTRQQGRLTGSLVQRIREDWEALGAGDSHPATDDAVAAYKTFVVRYGALQLFELLGGQQRFPPRAA
jgi:hypothetical protein